MKTLKEQLESEVNHWQQIIESSKVSMTLKTFSTDALIVVQHAYKRVEELLEKLESKDKPDEEVVEKTSKTVHEVKKPEDKK